MMDKISNFFSPDHSYRIVFVLVVVFFLLLCVIAAPLNQITISHNAAAVTAVLSEFARQHPEVIAPAVDSTMPAQNDTTLYYVLSGKNESGVALFYYAQCYGRFLEPVCFFIESSKFTGWKEE